MDVTAFDKNNKKIMAIGRLDEDSEGLLLLTTDGKVSENCSTEDYRKRVLGASEWTYYGECSRTSFVGGYRFAYHHLHRPRLHRCRRLLLNTGVIVAIEVLKEGPGGLFTPRCLVKLQSWRRSW